MKKITILLVMLVTFSTCILAQNCTPSGSGAVPDFGALLPAPLPNSTVNVAYQQSITIGVPSFVMVGDYINGVLSAQFDTVTSSLGNSWVVVDSVGGGSFPEWAIGSWHCVTLKGTPVYSGVDSITVYLNEQIEVMGGSLPYDKEPCGKLVLTVKAPQAIADGYLDNQVSVFPNPSVDGKYLIEVDQPFEMAVCDMTGRVILLTLIEEGKATIDLANERAGVYFVRLSNDRCSKVISVVR